MENLFNRFPGGGTMVSTNWKLFQINVWPSRSVLHAERNTSSVTPLGEPPGLFDVQKQTALKG